MPTLPVIDTHAHFFTLPVQEPKLALEGPGWAAQLPGIRSVFA